LTWKSTDDLTTISTIERNSAADLLQIAGRGRT
jgi:hypothetical protein